MSKRKEDFSCLNKQWFLAVTNKTNYLQNSNCKARKYSNESDI